MSSVGQSIYKFASNLVSDLAYDATPNSSQKVSQIATQSIAHLKQPGMQLLAQSISIGRRAVDQYKQNQDFNGSRLYDSFRHYVQKAVQYRALMPNKLGYKSTATRLMERLTSPLKINMDYKRMAPSLMAKKGNQNAPLAKTNSNAPASNKPIAVVAKTTENKADATKPSVVEGGVKGLANGVMTLFLSPISHFQTRVCDEKQSYRQAIKHVIHCPGAGGFVGALGNVVENVVTFTVAALTGSSAAGGAAGAQVSRGFGLVKRVQQTQLPEEAKKGALQIAREIPAKAYVKPDKLVMARSGIFFPCFEIISNALTSLGCGTALSGAAASTTSALIAQPFQRMSGVERKFSIQGKHEEAKLRNLIPMMWKEGIRSFYHGAGTNLGVMALRGIIYAYVGKAVRSLFDSKKEMSLPKPAPQIKVTA